MLRRYYELYWAANWRLLELLRLEKPGLISERGFLKRICRQTTSCFSLLRARISNLEWLCAKSSGI